MTKKSGDRQSVTDQLSDATQGFPEEPITRPPLPSVLRDRPEPRGGRKRGPYPSEVNRVKATYDIDLGTKDAIKAISIRERLPRNQSKIASAFLRFCVDEYQSGRLVIEVTDVDGDLVVTVTKGRPAGETTFLDS